MSKVNAEVIFRQDFDGTLVLPSGDIAIGKQAAHPYDLLQGALASCLHATFLDILKKMRLEIEGCRYELMGNKKEDVPTTLDVMHLDVYVTTEAKQEQIEKAFALATKYCSVYQTIAHVAAMSYTLYFGA